MKKRYSRQLVSILMLLFIVFSAAGCGQSATPASQTPAPSGSSATSSAAPEKDPYEGLPREVSVMIFDRGTVPPEKGTYESNDVTQWINENSPLDKVTFVAVPRWEVGKTTQVWLASNSAPDIIMDFDLNAIATYAKQGSLMEVSGLLDSYGSNIRSITPEDVRETGLIDGVEYGIPQIRPETKQVNWMAYIRQDWLDNLGLKMPATQDELTEVLRAFSEDDPDGNGQKDTYGMDLAWIGTGLVNNMFGVMSDWLPNASGDLELNTVHENFRAATQYKKELYDKKYVDPEFVTHNAEKVQQDFVSGKTGILACGYNYLTNIYDTIKTGNPNAVIAPMPLPSSSVGQYGYFKEPPCFFVNAITTSCKNPKAAVEYLDWMISEGWSTVKYGTDKMGYYSLVDGVYAATDKLTSDVEKLEMTYRSEYAILTNEFISASDYMKIYASADASIQAVKSIEAKALEVSLAVPFTRYLPTRVMGLQEAVDFFTSIGTFADDTYLKAVISGNSYTAEQAYQDVVSEYKNQGYENVKGKINEIYKANYKK